MTAFKDPRGSAASTSKPRSPGGIVVRPSLNLPRGTIDSSILFGKIGLHLHDMGWNVLPQTQGVDGTSRQPGTTLEHTARGQARQMIKYKAEWQMHLRMAPREQVLRWINEGHYNRNLNVALVTGDSPGTHGVIAVDGDILDPDLAPKIWGILDRTFGYSPLMRGRAGVPKAALLYRRKLGALRLPRMNFEFEAQFDGSKQVLEIKDNGALITIYGQHHANRDPYQWLRGAEPYTIGSEGLPEVDEEMILEAIRAIHLVSPIKDFDRLLKEYNAKPVQWADTDIGELRVPMMPEWLSSAASETDGRKDWLWARSRIWVRLNAGVVAPLLGADRAVNPEGVAQVAAAIIAESQDYLDWSVTTGKSLTQHNAHRIVSDMVRRTAEKLARGEPGFEPIGTRRFNPETQAAEPVVGQGVEQSDDEYSWLPRTKDRKRIATLEGDLITRTDPDKGAATAVALVMDRYEIEARVAREIREAIMAWLDALWAWKSAGKEGKRPPLPSVLLRAPTGSGKTTALLRCLREWKTLHPGCQLGPILMLLPSYGNIGEVAGRDDLGVWIEEDEVAADRVRANADKAGLLALIYKGKLAAGCQMADRVKALQAGGISSSGLCEAEVMEESDIDGRKITQKVTKFCRFHPDNPDFDDADTPCAAILQRAKIATADLVLAPHAFLTTNIPSALSEVSAIVIDEKIWDQTIGIKVLPLDTFLAGRDEPVLTKKEKEEGKRDPAWAVHARNAIGRVIVDAAKARKDIARAVREFELYVDGKENMSGEKALEEARWVTGRLQRVVMEINPETSLREILSYVKSKKAKNLVEEHITLGLLQERVEAFIAADDKPGLRLRPGGSPLAPRGETDHRIQLVDDGANLRVSWRKKINFDDLPILWLDASGHQKIIEKIWQRDIDVVDIDAPLYVRTVWMPDQTNAKSRLVPDRGDGSDVRVAKAARQVILREAMTAVSMMHGDGAVVAATALNLRRHLQRNWHQPANLHFMHYGATRGIDFAKHHSAAFSVGQLELAPRELDAYVGALSYDDLVPETPSDPFGNGRDGIGEDAKPLARRMVEREQPLRDGGVAKISVYEPAGTWAAIIVEQVRDEELRQFLGRLRPVYRSGRAPTWYHAGRVLPRGVVVDEIIAIDDLARPFGRTIPLFHELGVGQLLTKNFLGTVHLSGVSDAAIAKAHNAMCNSHRLSRGFWELGYMMDGETLTAFVPGYISDPTRIVRERVYGAREIRITREPRFSSYAVPSDDKIEIELGPRDHRAWDYDAAMEGLRQRFDMGEIDFDEKRMGIKINGRAQAPHLVAAIEDTHRTVAQLIEDAQPDLLADVPPEHVMLDDISAQGIVTLLAGYDDEIFQAILDRAAVDDGLRAEIMQKRVPKPVTIHFDEKVAMPAAANGDQPVPELGPNVIRFPSLVGFGVAPITRRDATGS
jgi:hypothetical protein